MQGGFGMIYIIEDDSNIQEIETYALENSGYKVKSFSEGASFFQALNQELPELILLDIMLPNSDGLTILKELRQREDTNRIPVLIISAKTSELDKVKGLDFGADDYLSKPFGVMELVSRVKALLRRSNFNTSKQKLSYAHIRLEDDKHLVFQNDELIELTFKEYELLKYFMLNQGIALTRSQIQEKVWGYSVELESRTIDMHINTLRKKINDIDASIIKTIRNVGYKFGE